MPSKRNDRGGEDRGKGDSEDAAKAARRAARDRAFGRKTPAGGNDDTAKKSSAQDDPLGALFGRYRDQNDDLSDGPLDTPHEGEEKIKRSGQRREIPRRELPMAGSASELRRLRKGAHDIPGMLEKIKCDALAADISKKKRLLYGAMLVVGIGIVVYIVASYFQLRQVVSVTKFSLIAAPICLAFAVNDLCMRLARRNPRLATRILSFLTLGNADSLRNLAHLHMDMGDYAKAEKTLSSSIGAIDPKRKLRDYILMHALFANLRAHVGRSTEAEKLVRDVLNAAEAHDKERNTNGSAFLLANTLNYAAQLCDVTDKVHDALALARRSVKLLCEHDMPPPDVTLVALYNAGYYCNVIGEFQEALLYLNKAQELAKKTGIARDGEQAFIFSNLAIANLGVGRTTNCKRLLTDAEARAMEPLGMSERPHTYQCWAIYHFANDRLEYSLESYEKAIDFCSQQTPPESVFLLRIIKEYTILLRELGKTREAKANEQRVTQIRETLHTLSAYVPTKKDRKIKPLKVPVTKSRFPIFYVLAAGMFGVAIWGEGVRLASIAQWLFFLTSLVVIAVKIRAKYGPPVKQETSQGAIIAIVSVIPGLRSVVPELSMVPQKTAGIIIGAAVAVFVFVQVTQPTIEMVPDGGLLGQEYLVLGDILVEKESLNKARKAYELASKNGAGPIADMKLKRDIPRDKQPDDAIEENMKALQTSQEKSPKAAKRARILWEQCVAKYPEFEYPYVHLAALINPNNFEGALGDAVAAAKAKSKKKQAKPDAEDIGIPTISRIEKRARAHEAEALLEKALAINPHFGLALLEMCSVKQNLGDAAGRTRYAKKFLAVTGDSDPVGKLLGERIIAKESEPTASSSEQRSEKVETQRAEKTESEQGEKTEPETAETPASNGAETTETATSAVSIKDKTVESAKRKAKPFEELKSLDERFEGSTIKPSARSKRNHSTVIPEDEWNDFGTEKRSSGMKKFVVKPTAEDATKETTKDSKPAAAAKAVTKDSQVEKPTSKRPAQVGSSTTSTTVIKSTATPKPASAAVLQPPAKATAVSKSTKSAETKPAASSTVFKTKTVETKPVASTTVSKTTPAATKPAASTVSKSKPVETKPPAPTTISKTKPAATKPAASTAISKSTKPTETKSAEARAERRRRSRDDKWMKFSPDDTDW
ncbi:MAG: hypothetical protein SGJ27_08125 [Candidatus Melainabacteria bacterium]|nr:hypothetical protein [Candidatus Melainabacteria bacterium]